MLNRRPISVLFIHRFQSTSERKVIFSVFSSLTWKENRSPKISLTCPLLGIKAEDERALLVWFILGFSYKMAKSAPVRVKMMRLTKAPVRVDMTSGVFMNDILRPAVGSIITWDISWVGSSLSSEELPRNWALYFISSCLLKLRWHRISAWWNTDDDLYFLECYWICVYMFSSEQ